MTAIPNTINGISLGSNVAPQATFILPSNLDVSSSVVTWEILDGSGIVYLSGNATSVISTAIGNGKIETIANASLTIPTTLPLTEAGTKYQIAWTMTSPAGVIISTYVETLLVYPNSYQIIGVPDIVEVAPMTSSAIFNANLTATLESSTVSGNDTATVVIFSQNTPVYTSTALAPSTTTAQGNVFDVTVNDIQNTYSMTPALSPYICLWQYKDVNTQLLTSTDGYFYYITPSILQAAYELQNAVNRARNPGRLAELDINLNVLLSFLKVAADMFNASGYVTYFTMTNPQGAIRAYWLAMAEVLILRSQYLLEAERAFNLSGQSANLDLDITQYYDTMASSKQAWIDSEIPNFKKNLQRRGINTGDGSMGGPNSSYTGSVGVAITPLSNYYGFYSRRYPRFRG